MQRLCVLLGWVIALAPLAASQGQQLTPLDNYAPVANGQVNHISGSAGSYYVAGDFTAIDSLARIRIAHLLTSGAVDPAFDTGAGPNASVFALLSEASGNVLVGGGFSLIGTTSRPALARLTSTGSIDATVSTTATVVTSLAKTSTHLLAAGNFPRSDAPGLYSMRIVRMAYPAGFTGNNYDTSFVEPTINGSVYSMLVLSTGQILIGGEFTAVNNTTRTNLALLNANGTLAALNVAASGGPVRTLADYGSDYVVVGGEFTSLAGNISAKYYGVLSTTSGTLLLNRAGPAVNGPVRSAVAYGSSDEVLLGGDFTTVGGLTRGNLAKVNLANNTTETTALANTDGSVRAILTDPALGNAVVLGGNFSTVAGTARTRMARLLPHGTLDTTYASATGGSVRALALQIDGQALVGGNFTTIGLIAQPNLARVQASGGIDASYAPAVDGPVNAIATLADGSAWVGGLFTTAGGATRSNLGKILATGAADTTVIRDVDGEVLALALQSDGKLLIAGAFTTLNGQPLNRLARLNADFTVDASFNPNLDGTARALALQTNGQILVGGDFLTVAGTAHARLARLNADGTLDATFTATAGNTVRAISVDSAGGIQVGGDFTTGSSFAQSYMASLTSTGAVAQTLLVDGPVRTLARSATGAQVLGGDFTSVASRSAIAIARVGTAAQPGLSISGSGASVAATAIQADGLMLVGGSFSSMGDSSRSNLGRWGSGNAPVSTLSVDGTGTTITWTRSGSTADIASVLFDISADNGVTWTALGTGTRSSSNWQITGVTVPANVSRTLRARGIAPSGSSSGWVQATQNIVRSTATFTITTQPADVSAAAGQTTAFSVVTSSTSGLTYQWRKNGNNLSGATFSTLSLSAVQASDAGLYSVAINHTSGYLISRDAALAVVAPIILTQPEDLTVNYAVYSTLSVACTPGTQTYQWFRDGTILSGATSNSYSNYMYSSAIYSVVITNAIGSTTSRNASITINTPITITSYPQNAYFIAGGTAVFSVVATGTQPTYQWQYATNYPYYYGWTNINNATSPTLTVANPVNGYYYRVIVSNNVNSVQSSYYGVNSYLVSPPVISSQPSDSSVNEGDGIYLSSYSYSLGVTYQWHKAGTPISGATNYTFSKNAVLSDAGSYTLVMTNAAGSVTSRTVIVQVSPRTAPIISQQPQAQIVLEGQPVTLSVTAGGLVPITYQWRRNGARLVDAVSSELILSAPTQRDTGLYSCLITNGLGVTLSRFVNVVVVDNSAITLTAPLRGRITFPAQTTAGGVIFQWQKGGTPLPSATSPTLTLTNLALTDAGDYSCKVSLGASSVVSGVKTLVVQNNVPVLTTTSLPNAQIAAPYDLTLTATGLPWKYTLKGLPAGLVVDTSTGHITGVPTKKGTFPIKITATNDFGANAATVLSLQVGGLVDGFAGRYVGITPTEPPMRLDLTVSDLGRYTGKVQFGTKIWPISGGLSMNEFGSAIISPLTLTHPTYGNIELLGSLDPSATLPDERQAAVILRFTPNPSTGIVDYTVTAWRAATSAAAFTGYYTVAFPMAENYGGTSAPEGTGYAALTGSSTGGMTLVGKMGDGTAFSTSSSVSSNGRLALFSLPYKDNGMLVGTPQIVAGSAAPYLDSTVSLGEQIIWIKPPTLTDRLYRDGYRVTLSALGAKYLSPKLADLTGPIVMNLTDAPDNARVSMGNGASSLFIGATGRINSSNAMSFVRGALGNDFNSIKVGIAPSTGIFTFSGTFYSIGYTGLPMARTTTGSGIIVSDANTLGGTGYGYMTVPLLPVDALEALSKTAMVSGTLVLGRP